MSFALGMAEIPRKLHETYVRKNNDASARIAAASLGTS
jgi:hypothetical protein